MPTQTAPAATRPVDLRPLLARITRDQGPEFEQTLAFSALNQVSTPTSIRTDRKIKFIYLHFRGRWTNAGTGPTYRVAPYLLSPPAFSAGAQTASTGGIVFSLIQQVTIRGQHLKYGSQTVFQMRGESIAEYLALLLPNYVPQFTVSANGAASIRFGSPSATLAQTNDVDFALPIPLFPPDVTPADSVMYSMHGPDWPGNIYLDVLFADGTALASANPPVSFTAFGSASGTPVVDILTVRPLLGKDYMASIRGAITFRLAYTNQPTTTVLGAGGSGSKLADLTVGKDTSRVWLKTGTQQTGTSAGVVVFASLSDSIVTRTVIATDVRQLRFQNANADSALQDYMAMSYGRSIPIGYKLIDFVSGPGTGAANPKAAFGSSQLTAARKFELDGDVTGGANQAAEVVQEMILGAPGVTM